MSDEISRRKAEHLRVAASGEADFKRPTLLGDVRLVHQALPERALAEIQLGTTLAGKELRAPLVIAGMTGGTAEAGAINRDLAQVAERLGLAFGVGSMRALAQDPSLEDTFAVRRAAPGVLLFGNLGAVQARDLGVERVRELCKRIEVDALCVHFNVAQELVQIGGDRDFAGLAETCERLVMGLSVAVIAKETGCGFSPRAAARIAATGIRTVDVSGAGGTSWVAVEARRAPAGSAARRLGESLWDWGVPTAVSVVACAREGLEVIATGGLRSGLDAARALALGARAAGLAAPVLRAHQAAGQEGAQRLLEEVIAELAAVTLMTGRPAARELTQAPKVITGELRDWLGDLELGGPGGLAPPGGRSGAEPR